MNNQFDKIEAYIKGGLSEKEMEIFQKEMKKNENLLVKVHLHRLEWEAMHLIREDKLRTKLQTLQKEAPLIYSLEELEGKVKSPKIKNKFINQLLIAASITLVIGIGGWYFLSNQYSNDALFASLDNIPQLSSSYKSTGSISSSYNRHVST